MEIKTIARIEKRYERRVTRSELLKALNISPSARVHIEVPRGGDWSGQELDIDNCGEDGSSLTVTWLEVSEVTE